MKKGEVYRIFQDPITKGDFEGRAVLRAEIAPGVWSVHFLADLDVGGFRRLVEEGDRVDDPDRCIDCDGLAGYLATGRTLTAVRKGKGIDPFIYNKAPVCGQCANRLRDLNREYGKDRGDLDIEFTLLK